MEKINIEHVFVAHVKTGYEERAVYLEKQMQLHEIKFTYMLDGDMEDISDARLEKYFTGEMKKVSGKTSCALKHILIAEKICADNIPMALVFEDDILLKKNFTAIFNKTISELKGNKEIVENPFYVSYENSGFKNVKQPVTEKFLYPENSTRGTGVYLISLSAAENLLVYAAKKKLTKPIDWTFNQLADEKNIFIYWCHPIIAEQGSFTGKFSSSIGNKKAGIIRKVSYRIQKLMKKKRH